MCAAVMGSNFYSQQQVHSWMLAMAQYPPPPTSENHYNPIFPTGAATAAAAAHHQELLSPVQQDHLQYSNLNTPLYPKAEHGNDGSSSQHMQSIAHELQHHAALEEQQRQHIQHAAQQVQHHGPPTTPHGGVPVSISQAQQQAALEQTQKTNRLRKACDSCSIRKVKCDESGPPCRACAALDIPCTFERPSRRRGPPNRHAEAIKRRRLEEAAAGGGGGSPHLSGTSTPSSPTHAAQALAALSSQPAMSPYSAESICPIETIDLLIDDFFTYIHPLCPFPHEPSFREAWKRREDLNNPSFLALLASMIGALVSSFPRKPRLHLKAQRRESLFPNHMSLVHRCQQICSAARGPGYLERENLNVYDAATSFFMALMGIYTFRWRLGRLYFGECLTIIRTLGLHKASGPSTAAPLGALPAIVGSRTPPRSQPDNAVDNITVEMGRRIFWTMFVTVKLIQQSGASFGELVIPPPTPTEPHPPLPVEVDDFCIYPTHNEPQPEGLVPIVAGFNANCKIYCSYNSLATMETAWGIDSLVDWDRQHRVLQESLRQCKLQMVGLPTVLTLYPDGQTFAGASRSNGNAYPSNLTAFNLPRGPAQSQIDLSQRMEVDQSPEDRRRTQYEIQKANIYASSLSTRSYIVEKYFNLCEAYDRSRNPHSGSRPNSPGASVTAAGIDGMIPSRQLDRTGHDMRQERESIVKDLLVVLSSIDQVNMEPNADSFTMKIRSIASTLLDQPDQRKGQIALQTQEYLGAFLKILMRLERVSPANSDPDQAEDEETELRQWADLREYQLKFAQQGGLVGMS